MWIERMPKKAMSLKKPPFLVATLLCLCLQLGCSTFSEALKSKNDFGLAAKPGESLLGFVDAGRSTSTRTTAKNLSDAEYNSQILQGKNFERVKKWEEARAVYEPLIAARPDRYEAYHRLAVVADRQQRYSEAEALYSQAIRLSPGNPELFNDLGYSFLLQHEFAKAEVAILKAVALSPSNARYRNNLGLAYGFQSRYDAAMEQFRKAGSEADACCNMAFVLSQQGRLPEAEQYLRIAISRDPQHKAARKALESLYTTPEAGGDAFLADEVRRWETYENYGRGDPSLGAEPSVIQASHATPSTAARAVSFGRPTAQSHLRSARSAWSAGIQEQTGE